MGVGGESGVSWGMGGFPAGRVFRAAGDGGREEACGEVSPGVMGERPVVLGFVYTGIMG